MARAGRAAPRWYFSFRSPYAWFAYRDLVDSHPEVARTIEWIPSWEPGPACARLLAEAGTTLPYVPMSRAKFFYILQDARRIARSRGLPMTWPPPGRDPDWDVPHLGQLAASALGKGPAYVEAVYRARWERGEDICDPETIAAVAESIGLPSSVAEARQDPELCEEGARILTRSYRDDVFGVPLFLHGREKYFGVERLPLFVEALTASSAGTVSPPEPVPAPAAEWSTAPGADAAHAGGCG